LENGTTSSGEVEFQSGELFPRVGFIVTNLSLPSRAVVRFYNERGTAEQWIKEGKQATHWTRLSCHRFRANEARLQLSLLAYNLGNLWRRLVLPNYEELRKVSEGAMSFIPSQSRIMRDRLRAHQGRRLEQGPGARRLKIAATTTASPQDEAPL
jgi:Transposase DDE domain group 1